MTRQYFGGLNALGSILAAVLWILPVSHAWEWRGYIAQETRLFLSDPLDAGQEHAGVSLALEPRLHHDWADDSQRLVFTPFIRLNERDDERTHVDIRELYWEKIAPSHELRLGFRKVFWGVTESQHLVDIINQTDLVENIDTEDKLGQPMLNFAWINDWGAISFFAMPYFRERTFPGPVGRLRPNIPIETDAAEFESDAEQWHPDFAVRFNRSAGSWDFGLSQFYGTSREPRLLPRLEGLSLELTAYYDIIHQSGVDIQRTKGGWLWKFEGIHRSGQERTFTAITAGFEYTFYGVFGSAVDVGLLSEYLWDSRGRSAPRTPFDDDIFVGTRITFNDTQDTNLLAGVIVDSNTGAAAWSVEGFRRIGESLRLSAEARLFTGVPPTDPVYTLRKDDYVQVELAWYF